MGGIGREFLARQSAGDEVLAVRESHPRHDGAERFTIHSQIDEVSAAG